MSDPRTDEALMGAYRDGDTAAFQVLYDRWRGRLYRYLAHQAPGVADELYQDVWMKLVGARDHYEATARFSTWLFRIAHNRLMDHFRARSRSLVAAFGESDEDPAQALPAPETESPPAVLERRQAARRILDCLEILPAPQREAFLLAEESGLTLAQIAQAAGVGRETVKSRLRYALDRLRRCLAELKAG